MATNPSELGLLSNVDAGLRLRTLRELGHTTQTELAAAIGYKEGTSSGVSIIESGNRRLTEIARRRAAKYLAGKGILVEDERELEGYLIGDHDSLDRCVQRRRGDLNPGRGFSPHPPWNVVRLPDLEDRKAS